MVLGVDAEKRSLEDITTPLTAEEKDDTADSGSGNRPPAGSRETVGSSAGSSHRHYH